MIYPILGVLLLLLVAFLAAPLSLGYDSTEKWLKVKWLGVTITKKLGEKREKPRKMRPRARRKARKKWRFQGSAVTARLWQARDLILEVIGRLGRFAVQVFRALSFRNSEVTLSLPDPAWNGMLSAALTHISSKDLNLTVNFLNRNYAKIWVTLYPYRLAWEVSGLLLRLPLIRLGKLAWALQKCRQPL